MSSVFSSGCAIFNPYSNKNGPCPLVCSILDPSPLPNQQSWKNIIFFSPLPSFFSPTSPPLPPVYSNNSYVIISAFRTRLVDQIQTVPPSRVGLTACATGNGQPVQIYIYIYTHITQIECCKGKKKSGERSCMCIYTRRMCVCVQIRRGVEPDARSIFERI